MPICSDTGEAQSLSAQGPIGPVTAMPLKLAFMEEDDAPAFATFDELAMQDWPVGRAMVNDITMAGDTRREVIEKWLREGLHDPQMSWLKVIDTDLNGEMVAIAVWRFELASGPDAKKAEPDEATNKDELTDLDRAWEDFGRPFEAEFVGERPHGSLILCQTHPMHQRRGAGRMLLGWGCDYADERGLMCVLQASWLGLRLYESFGFVVVKQGSLDLLPFGIDQIEIRRGMIRPAKAPA